ncbi:MAG: EAL domain-containing protein [Tepidanaerobacteraceae bacterium]
MLRQFYSDQCKLFNTHTDQFVFYLKEYKDKNELLLLCESIANALGELLRTERIGFGIGVVEIDDNYHDVDELLKRLLIASEKSISSSDAEFSPCFYGSHIESEIMWEDDIKRELANIIDDDNDGGLYLQYQPILDLRSNQICGFEALSRLKSNKLGLVSPLEFDSSSRRNETHNSNWSENSPTGFALS